MKKEIKIELKTEEPKIIKQFKHGRIGLDIYENNAIMFKLNNENVNWFFAEAKTRDNFISSSDAKIVSIKEKIQNDKLYITITYKKKDLKLGQYFEIEKDKNYLLTYISLSGKDIIESNYLVPLDFIYPRSNANPLFLSLNQKILCVPYDNDMWVHYDSLTLRPGRTSYDVGAIYDDNSLNGLLIGALDFDTFKNGIRCSAYDARSYKAISGIADENTHDHLEHGFVSGKTVSSSRFILGYYEDIRDGLEEYGRLAKNNNGIFEWKHGVPFGWNSYSALTLDTTIKNMHSAADFIYDKLDNFKGENGETYINFDAVENISADQIKKFIKKLHQRKQKVGWYMNPLSHLEALNEVPLRGSNLKRKDILLKNNDGSNYPKIDNKYPIDITIPEAELDFRLALREFVEYDFDYLKLDFLSHGALEGKYHNKDIRTGRQALMYFYNIVKEELDPEKIGKEIFISSSIDPLFPCGYSHARRSCCDSFGHHEDVKYVLNSLTYAYWTNNTLYKFNDPDHTVLYKSLVDGRDSTTLSEARSRYNASLISGTLMLLSDDYGPADNKEVDNAKKRVLKLANNKELNNLTKLNKAFKPLVLHETSNIYYLNDVDNYIAVFNFENKEKTFTINPADINFRRSGTLLDINNNIEIKYNKNIEIKLKAYDSIILKVR